MFKNTIILYEATEENINDIYTEKRFAAERFAAVLINKTNNVLTFSVIVEEKNHRPI